MSSVVLVAIVSCVCIVTSAATAVLKNGGYEGVVVSVDEKVPSENCRSILNNLEVSRHATYLKVWIKCGPCFGNASRNNWTAEFSLPSQSTYPRNLSLLFCCYSDLNVTEGRRKTVRYVCPYPVLCLKALFKLQIFYTQKDLICKI